MSDSDKSKDFHMTVGGKQIDFSTLGPLTLGDKKRLQAEGVDFVKYALSRAINPEDEAKIVLHVVRKKRPETTMEEIDELPTLVAGSFLQYVMKRSLEVDDPFSTRSTSSAPITDGASAKSDSDPKLN